MPKLSKVLLFLFFIGILILTVFVLRYRQVINNQKNIGEVTIVPSPMNKNEAPSVSSGGASPSSAPLPVKVLIDVPFTSQAPLGMWDAYHEESCEETSLIMLKYFLDKKPLNPQIAEGEIQKMIAFEIQNYGDYKDTNMEKNVKIFNDFYGSPYDGKKLKVIYDFQKDDLKKYLALGNPIIVPEAGQMLGNPNYTPPGPVYHNLVLVGYDGNTIITNDSGTRKGKSYRYSIDVIYNALHDFPGYGQDIKNGRKAMIVLE